MPASRRLLLAITTSAALALVANAAGAQGTRDTAAVARIRELFAGVERRASSYSRVERDVEGFSVDGGKLTAYFDGDTLRKVHVDHHGESGQAFEDNYFANGKLVFVFLVVEHFTRPYSGRVRSRTEHRYYFSNDRLIRHLRTPTRHADVDGPDPTSAELLKAAGTYVRCAKAPSSESPACTA